jgi:hypothetical protein
MRLSAALFVFAAAVDVKGDAFLQKEKLQQDADPEVITHKKVPGNGYEKGPTYNPNNPDEPLTTAAPGVVGAAAGVIPSIDQPGVPPVSTTMKCVINLTIQYFLVYTALAVGKTYVEFSGNPSRTMMDTLVAATGSVAYAPMLSVLFLGVRMRAIQLSQGNPDYYKLPQDYVKFWMQACSWAVLIQTLLVLALPLVLGKSPSVSEDGSPEVPEGGGIVAKILGALRWVAMAMLYGGFTVVCYGGITMEAPAEIWEDEEGGAPPVSPAVQCTMNLACQYFFVYLAIAVIQTMEQFGGRSENTRKLASVFQLATNTVNFAPMLAILFIGARMRALQIDPKNGNPQSWAQNCFYLCAGSLALQLVLVLVVPLVLGGRVIRGESEGDVTFELPNPTLFWILSMVRFALMVALYGGATAVIVSVNIIKAKDGETPAVSPAMQCVMNLTLQYFFVYLLIWLLLTLKQLALVSLKPFLSVAIPTMEAAKGSVMFAPMLAVLFIGLRMRALQITDNRGSPQKWAQQGMFLCTYAILMQVLLVMTLPLFMGDAPKTDGDGNVISKPSSPVLGYIIAGVRYLALLGVYGGAITCVVALFKITPETADGSGPNLVPGVEVPTPPAPPGQSGSFFF